MPKDESDPGGTLAISDDEAWLKRVSQSLFSEESLVQEWEFNASIRPDDPRWDAYAYGGHSFTGTTLSMV